MNSLLRKTLGKLLKSQKQENILALKKLLAYVRPQWPRLGLGVVLGTVSAMFNALMLISFQLFFSLVLKGGTPADAIRCFLGTDMDILVMENIVLYKKEMPAKSLVDYRSNFELD